MSSLTKRDAGREDPRARASYSTSICRSLPRLYLPLLLKIGAALSPYTGGAL